MYRMKNAFSEVAPGVFQQWPITREQSEIQRLVYYQPLPGTDPCGNPDHGAASIRYTATGIARCCALADSLAEFTKAKENGEPVSPAEAFQKGLDYYYKDIPGKQCGHTGKKLLDGKCWFCRTEKKPTRLSPRQRAVKNGEDWYMPEENDPCREGHIALRRVNNGQCSECTGAKINIPDPLWRQCPDLIITKEDAVKNGFSVYRTGQPCRKGHRAFRYVSTGSCLACMGRK